MDLFSFIHHSDPNKVRIGEQNLTNHEVKLLKMTEGHTVLLNPPVTAAPGDSGDNIDKMFDEGNNANQEHSVGKDDDVLEEAVALEASEVGAEKAKKKQKRKMTEGVSGSVYRPKKLRDDHQSLPPPTGGKSLSALCGMVSEGSAILSDATEPLATASVTLISYYSGSYSETASLVRSAADVLVVTVAVTTTVDANVATGSKTKDRPKYFEHIRDSASSLDTDIMHRVYVLRWKLRVMDNDQLYSEFNVGAVWQVYIGVEVRMRAEHTLERKSKLKDRCAKQATLLLEKDAEIAHLRSFLSLKEVEAAEAISLRRKLSVVEAADAVKALEFVVASNEVELASLSSQVVNLTADLSGFQLSRDALRSKVASLESERDCLATQKNSLESAFELFKEQVEKMQDEQVGVLSDCVAAIDSDLMEMVLHMDDEFYPRYLTTIAERRWILSPGIKHGIAEKSITDVAAFNPSTESDYIDAINALQGVSFLLLAQLKANKDASMADIMDLLCLEGPVAETFKASQLQPSLDQLMIPIHRLEDQVPPSPKVVFEEEELDTMLEHVPAL
nr:hypothetical protein [Tanacetum cinerariifolium]